MSGLRLVVAQIKLKDLGAGVIRENNVFNNNFLISEPCLQWGLFGIVNFFSPIQVIGSNRTQKVPFVLKKRVTHCRISYALVWWIADTGYKDYLSRVLSCVKWLRILPDFSDIHVLSAYVSSFLISHRFEPHNKVFLI